MKNLLKVKKFQLCLLVLLIGFAFLLQNCQKDELLTPQNDLENVNSEALLEKGGMSFEILDLAFEIALIANGIEVIDHYALKQDVNQITELDISGEKDNKGTIKDLTGIENFRQLEKLNCSFNVIENLDVSKNTFLKVLKCQDNLIPDLDLSNNKTLEELYSATNKLESLDLRKNKALTVLTCATNLFTSLDVNMITDLSKFNCQKNPSLGCIQVSQIQLDNLLTADWKKDDGAVYSLDCSN